VNTLPSPREFRAAYSTVAALVGELACEFVAREATTAQVAKSIPQLNVRQIPVVRLRESATDFARRFFNGALTFNECRTAVTNPPPRYLAKHGVGSGKTHGTAKAIAEIIQSAGVVIDGKANLIFVAADHVNVEELQKLFETLFFSMRIVVDVVVVKGVEKACTNKDLKPSLKACNEAGIPFVEICKECPLYKAVEGDDGVTQTPCAYWAQREYDQSKTAVFIIQQQHAKTGLAPQLAQRYTSYMDAAGKWRRKKQPRPEIFATVIDETPLGTLYDSYSARHSDLIWATENRDRLAEIIEEIILSSNAEKDGDKEYRRREKELNRKNAPECARDAANQFTKLCENTAQLVRDACVPLTPENGSGTLPRSAYVKFVSAAEKFDIDIYETLKDIARIKFGDDNLVEIDDALKGQRYRSESRAHNVGRFAYGLSELVRWDLYNGQIKELKEIGKITPSTGDKARFMRLAETLEKLMICIDAERDSDAGSLKLYVSNIVRRNKIVDREICPDIVSLINEDFRRGPLMVLDATTNEQHVALFTGTDEGDWVVGEGMATTPFAKFIKVPTKKTSSTALMQSTRRSRKKKDDAKSKRKRKRVATERSGPLDLSAFERSTNANELERQLMMLAAENGASKPNDLFVIGNKRYVHGLKQRQWAKDAGIVTDEDDDKLNSLMWHGKTRGSNAAEKCRVMAIFGTFRPPISVVERMSVALSRLDGALPVPTITNRPQKMVAPVNGTEAHVDEVSHADPFTAGVLRQLCDAAAEQAYGRARAAQRTVNDPVTIIVFDNIGSSEVVPTIFDEVRDWAPPHEAEIFVARHGRMPKGPAEAAKLAPELFGNLKKASNLLKEYRKASFEASIKRGLSRAEFRPTGENRTMSLSDCRGSKNLPSLTSISHLATSVSKVGQIESRTPKNPTTKRTQKAALARQIGDAAGWVAKDMIRQASAAGIKLTRQKAHDWIKRYGPGSEECVA
jgi:hypothetical protein